MPPYVGVAEPTLSEASRPVSPSKTVKMIASLRPATLLFLVTATAADRIRPNPRHARSGGCKIGGKVGQRPIAVDMFHRSSEPFQGAGSISCRLLIVLSNILRVGAVGAKHETFQSPS